MRYIFGGKNYYMYIAIFPPICQGGKNGYIAIYPGGNLLYSHFSAYPGKGDKWLWGKNGSITPA